MFEIPELIEAGAGRGEKDDVSRLAAFEGHVDGPIDGAAIYHGDHRRKRFPDARSGLADGENGMRFAR